MRCIQDENRRNVDIGTITVMMIEKLKEDEVDGENERKACEKNHKYSIKLYLNKTQQFPIENNIEKHKKFIHIRSINGEKSRLYHF